MNKQNKQNSKNIILIFFFLLFSINLNAQTKKSWTWDDIMKFKAVRTPIISDSGKWVAYVAEPDRGDPELNVQSVQTDSMKWTFKRGTNPVFSKDENWTAAVIAPKQIDIDNLEKGKEKPKNGLVIINNRTGDIKQIDNVEKFTLSNTSQFLAYKLASEEKSGEKNQSKEKKIIGTNLILRQLESAAELTFEDVTDFAFDSSAKFLIYTVFSSSGKKNGIYFIDLTSTSQFPQPIFQKDNVNYSNISWSKVGKLAFISSPVNKEGLPGNGTLYCWESTSKTISTLIDEKSYPKEWVIPSKNTISWTRDGERLFFGFKPWKDTTKKETVKYTDSNFYDTKSILSKAELDVWHKDDPRIKTNQKNWWEKNKDLTYTSVYDFSQKKFIQLATLDIPHIVYNENPDYAMGLSEKPYMKEMTWDGDYRDVYTIRLKDGYTKQIAKKIKHDVELSPFGGFVAYFESKQWMLYDTKMDSTFNLTVKLKVTFFDEDEDTPDEPGSYGLGGWTENDVAVLIYDKYDVWKFYTGNGFGYLNTSGLDGRLNDYRIRLKKLDPEKKFYKNNETLFASSFHNKTKEQSVVNMQLDMIGIGGGFAVENKRLNLLSKAKNKDVYLYTRENWDEFPDLWIADSSMTKFKQISDVNPQMKNLPIGKAELTRWISLVGDTVQGYYILPDNYEKGKKYPVLVYFYEKFSDMFRVFYQPRIGHRPCYQQYLSDGYVIFVPDIKYKTGSPGASAYNCIAPGVKKLIDAGIADSSAIGIQGHSWGGYQTAFLITYTNMFAAACAGAPVGNMTSAYSGIRLESGLARQFQYEKQQSRIGGTLWDSLDSYVRNSPIFNAPKIKTPFLLMFGDEDDAVPWQQGIELYLALRRLDKNVVFLEYRNEPHIPRKYPDRLDYAIKMKEFYDTYLKKKPAPDWLLKGVEYEGK